MRKDAQKKHDQLGMNPSTAQNRLLKDILFKFVSQYEPECYVCGKPMTRDTFSIEHKTPWLDSYNPLALFFDVDNNISFSHLACNVSVARKANKKYATPEEAKQAGKIKQKQYRTEHPPAYCPEKRRQRYLTKGY